MFRKLPFALHAVIETAAAHSFIFHPQQQLPACSPAAKLILRQYGGLLLCSNLVCLVVLTRPECHEVVHLFAIALGSYHVWPCYRALARIRHDPKPQMAKPSPLGGPVVHLIVHLVCLVLFIFAAFFSS
ncbi:hypothetical protein F4780DRAFT_107847 [Xylariomycetidae sp. FL0641]|nr:hypothetical protein F4780DRAFT_107847 [Xylariomycetidae sp. FL0641]